VFEVDRRANKLEIKQAVQTIFDVQVLAVNTMVMKPKQRRLGRKTITAQSAWKRAVITLAPGERIQEFFEGI
jgi:large subunit ribosomal protein L23